MSVPDAQLKRKLKKREQSRLRILKNKKGQEEDEEAQGN